MDDNKKIHLCIKQHGIDVVYSTESKGIPNAAFGCIGNKAKWLLTVVPLAACIKPIPVIIFVYFIQESMA
ncbi:MAG: hypothetical protein ACJAZQ_002728 [Cognaticolwellia sp.]